MFNIILSNIESITPTRNFNYLYIILDSIFIFILLILLFVKKKYMTLIFGIGGGILYFLVDYGIFYLLLGSRKIYINDTLCDNLKTLYILLWMSLSYGITNFIYIWLLLDRSKDYKYFIFLIIAWWFVVPSISSLGDSNIIKTFRTTNEYHGIMGLFLIVSYLIFIIVTFIKKKEYISILRLNLIGISVQFLWESALLVNGIRPMNENSIQTLLVDSLIETNLGMPAIFLIYYLINNKINDDLTLKKENKNDE